ncbi:MAG: alcohol dehydrogenase, partial [Anaerostipes sp.]|nr:alcohol dehydrogenase [Anaerostipes sp.]
VVDVSKIVEEKTFTLDQIQEAYELASKPGMYRVSVLLDC